MVGWMQKHSIPVARTEDIPQADSLASLRDVVQSVGAGAVTTPEIEAAGPGSRIARQGTTS